MIRFLIILLILSKNGNSYTVNLTPIERIIDRINRICRMNMTCILVSCKSCLKMQIPILSNYDYDYFLETGAGTWP